MVLESKIGKLEYIPIKVEPQRDKFDLVQKVIEAIENNRESILDNDIIVIASKFVAMAEGRIVKLSSIHPSEKAKRFAKKLNISSRLAELIIKEADVVFGGVPGYVLTLKDGVLSPNAGIDKSNIYKGYVILHPSKPFEKAEELRKRIFEKTGKKIGVIITDSRLFPTRIGTIGVAIGVAGFEPIRDLRGKRDLFGNVLKVTRQALADDISSGAQLLMGEADESIPIVIVRSKDLQQNPIKFTDRSINKKEIIINYKRCIYLRGLSVIGRKLR